MVMILNGQKMKFKLSAVATVLMLTLSAHGQDVTFINASNTMEGGDWSTPSYWSTGSIPQPGDQVTLTPPISGASMVIDIRNSVAMPDHIIQNGTTLLHVYNDTRLSNVTIDVNGVTPIAPFNYSSQFDFFNTSSAGNAVINVIGKNQLKNVYSDTGLIFTQQTHADTATITVKDEALVHFVGSSSADKATISVGDRGLLIFGDEANLSAVSVSNHQGGVTGINESAQVDAKNARISNDAGGVLDISNNQGQVSLGQVEGAGDIYLGSNALAVGALNQDADISGVISDGTVPALQGYEPYNRNAKADNIVGGRLIKQGTGFRTLTRR